MSPLSRARQPLARRCATWVNNELIAAVALGLVHGFIGVAEQHAFMGAVLWEHRHANAGLDAQCQSIQLKWLSERCENFLGHRLGQLAGMNAFEQHHKLVPPNLATVSEPRTQACRRCATPCSSKSPIA